MVITTVSALLALLPVFGVPLEEDQIAAIVAAVNALLGVWVALTYKQSRKRLPDPQAPVVPLKGSDTGGTAA